MTPAENKRDSFLSWELACAMLHERQRLARLIAGRGR